MYQAVTGNATNLPKAGELIFFSVSGQDFRIPRSQVMQLWEDHNLDTELFSLSNLRACDVFRRVTSQAQQSVSSTSEDKTRLIVREVLSDRSRIVRHLVEEVADFDDETLSYTEVGKWELYNGTIRSDSFPGRRNAAYDAIVDHVTQQFNHALGYDEKKTITGLNHRSMAHLNPVSIAPHSSGKFVLPGYQSKVTALHRFWNELGNRLSDSDIHFNRIPLVSSDELEEVLTRRAGEVFTQEVQSISTGLLDILKKRGELRLSTINNYACRLKETKKRIEEYNQTLGLSLQAAQMQLMTALSKAGQTIDTERKKAS